MGRSRFSATRFSAIATLLALGLAILACESSPSAECSANGDCPGGYCVSGSCYYVPVAHDTSSPGPDLVAPDTTPGAEVADPCPGGCDDGEPCTQDFCGPMGCQHEPVAGCCHEDADCEDGDPCTDDLCLGGACTYAPAGDLCCESDEDCDDGTVATVDQCRDRRCRFVRPCGSDAECDDGEGCTRDWCDQGGCANDPLADCCQDAGDCNDGNVYTIDRCVEGVCVHEMLPGYCEQASDCDDADRCTVDSCDGDGNCQHEPLPECCNTVADCDDGDPCTAERCTDEGCAHDPVIGCCHTDADCDDGEPCTDDSCNASNRCSNRSAVDCCHEDGDCDDGNACTQDICDDNRCAHLWQEGCCLSAGDCDDDDPCTTNACQGAACVFAPIGGCCVVAADCDDGDPCTTELCRSNRCSWSPVPGCCLTDADCDDGVALTVDTCVASRCQHSQRLDCAEDADCDDGNPCTADSCILASQSCRNLLSIGGDCDCRADADCPGEDLVCSLLDAGPDYGFINFCVPRAGELPMGHPCDPANEAACASGLCVELDGASVCYGACVVDGDCYGAALCGEVAVAGPEGQRDNLVPVCIPLPAGCTREADCGEEAYCDAYTLPAAPAEAVYGCFPAEGRPGRMGEACTQHAQCASNFCIADESRGGICFGVCATSADCDYGQRCYEDLFGMTVTMGTPDTGDDVFVAIPTCLWDIGSQEDCVRESDCPMDEVCFPYLNDDYTGFAPACRAPLEGAWTEPGGSCTEHEDCGTGHCLGLGQSFFGDCLMFCTSTWDCDLWSDCESVTFTLAADPPEFPEEREFSASVCVSTF